MIFSNFIQKCCKMPKLAVIMSLIGHDDLLDLLIIQTNFVM